MVVNDDSARAQLMAATLQELGYQLVQCEHWQQLTRCCKEHDPDVIVLSVKRPSSVCLRALHDMTEQQPRPVVLFTEDDTRSIIESAIKAGVSAYIVDGLEARRIATIMEVAIARFKQQQQLQTELYKAKTSLEERKWIDRAKGILMQQKGVSEAQAYQKLRSQAMTQNARIADVARNLVNAAQLLN